MRFFFDLFFLRVQQRTMALKPGGTKHTTALSYVACATSFVERNECTIDPYFHFLDWRSSRHAPWSFVTVEFVS